MIFTDSTDISQTLQFIDLILISRKECQLVFGDIIDETKYCVSGAGNKGPCNVSLMPVIFDSQYHKKLTSQIPAISRVTVVVL